MPLDPQVENFLQMVKLRELPPLETLTPAEARKSFELSAQAMCRRYETVKTEDRVIQGFQDELNIRIYYPNEKPIGAIVYFHGGGWVIGNIETHDPLCHILSALSGSIVVSVDYGLAPENKFPGPVEDAYMAARWVWQHADSLGFPQQALGVAGDSAGGNLAAAVSYLAFKRREFNLCEPVRSILPQDLTTQSLMRNMEKDITWMLRQWPGFVIITSQHLKTRIIRLLLRCEFQKKR